MLSVYAVPHQPSLIQGHDDIRIRQTSVIVLARYHSSVRSNRHNYCIYYLALKRYRVRLAAANRPMISLTILGISSSVPVVGVCRTIIPPLKSQVLVF
jgi:hypothetical protein